MGENKPGLLEALEILRKYNLKRTVDVLLREGNLSEVPDNIRSVPEVSSVADKSEVGDSRQYETIYLNLRRFVDECLDIYKHELALTLYPVFVHMYLELVDNNQDEEAKTFMGKFGPEQEFYYQKDLRQLEVVRKRGEVSADDLPNTFKTNKFIIRMSRDTQSLLKRHLHEKEQSVIMNIVYKHLDFDLHEGVARNRTQCDATTGAMIGEARRQDNKVKVFYGLLKEPHFNTAIEAKPGEDDVVKSKKRKHKKEKHFSKKSKSEPNAPAIDRIPLPVLREIDKQQKIKALREASKRVNLSADHLPSACFYTILNAANSVTCAEISDDSTLLPIGLSGSTVKVWSLTSSKLREMKPVEQLKNIDRDADDVHVRMMDDQTAKTSQTLIGHKGPVYRCSFSPDKTMMLSCSSDADIRLWSLQTWTCVVVYRGHQFPVWDVCFSPHGYYFATCSHDKTARLWATDKYQPLRIFVGHYSDVDCVVFHPNSNYIATGSSDRTVRLWDCESGNYVRLFTGHKAAIYSLAFSMCGRFLASGSTDNRILIWDLAHGHLIAALNGHTETIHSLCFSRDGTILATGSLDCTLRLWDFTKLCEDINDENVNVSHNPDVRDGNPYLLRSFPTKSSPIIALHFTRRNLLLAVGRFEGSE